MGPLRPWDETSQVPATFAGSSAAAATPQASKKPHANANVKKQVILFIEESPLIERGALKSLDAFGLEAVTG
jgi:hypothetical protein